MPTPSQVINFRCPEELLEKMDELAVSLHRSRNAVMVEAVRLFCLHVRSNGGYVIPPYTQEVDVKEQHFRFKEEAES